MRRDWVYGLVFLTLGGDAAFGDQRPLFERQWKGAAAALLGVALGIEWWSHYRRRRAGSRPSAPRAVPVTGAAGGTMVVTMPDLGQGDSGGAVTRWLKAAGETVEADEPLVEVSIDKVDTEIPSPATGMLLEIRVAQDDVAPAGAALAVIGLRRPD
jgi:biotin carboxyl carrier protein